MIKDWSLYVQLPTSANNVALPAYAPERRTVALLLLTAYQVLSS